MSGNSITLGAAACTAPLERKGLHASEEFLGARKAPRQAGLSIVVADGTARGFWGPRTLCEVCKKPD